MAEAPSNIPASAAQAGFQANEVSKEREARKAAQSQTASNQVKALNESSGTVDTTDTDTAIFSDAEGTGSQGRAFDEEETEQDQEVEQTQNGISTDGDGRQHLDLEA